MNFCKVMAIIRPDRLEPVEHVLRELGVPGVSITRGKGFGEYSDFFTSDWMCSHTRVEVFIGADRSEETAQAIMDAAHTGLKGDGIVVVSPVESLFHVRTRRRCEEEACH